MADIFFASLCCRHALLTCWLLLTPAGAVHVSFSAGDHQRAMAKLLTAAPKTIIPPATGTNLGDRSPAFYRRLPPTHPAIRAGAEQTRSEILAYLDGRTTDLVAPALSPFLLAGTPFQQRVWARLSLIPYGETCTYGEIGTALGNRHLARAVGAACGANPCPLLIPCHRVVAVNGPGGFSGGGLAIKKKLLALEGTVAKERP
ncbi:methylated-DNA--[protein]-cysteine S-methyltransferase [Desulfurivibrio alkaliphilus]|uniref:methylated-DNA--[protein]-cysteine S-methyltransferase n=1 Tax=Desulfurivibrio alkaliphilus (strain DSM 19089 / UNIQEM U267 / AHT2) TaxID=589865 RepID=D6Z496_DESAT|nr:methylated-DNA--[protein]-cysteine S-methyltransferase [Desulfurivibrio alkaliphilus]ADH86371.1 methylated-DNA/protein-cysteine methyltransferase [Desulfurivibrio alkaliphilus AHT 2]